MKPMHSTVTIDRPREEIYAVLADLRAHERFTDHFLTDFSGGADRIRMRARTPGPAQWSDVELVEKDAPTRLVERLVAAGGKREMVSTYRLEDAGDGTTRVSFTSEYVKAPAADRALAPVLRAFLTKNNDRALTRLKEQLEAAS